MQIRHARERLQVWRRNKGFTSFIWLPLGFLRASCLFSVPVNIIPARFLYPRSRSSFHDINGLPFSQHLQNQFYLNLHQLRHQQCPLFRSISETPPEKSEILAPAKLRLLLRGLHQPQEQQLLPNIPPCYLRNLLRVVTSLITLQLVNEFLHFCSVFKQLVRFLSFGEPQLYIPIAPNNS